MSLFIVFIFYFILVTLHGSPKVMMVMDVVSPIVIYFIVCVFFFYDYVRVSLSVSLVLCVSITVSVLNYPSHSGSNTIHHFIVFFLLSYILFLFYSLLFFIIIVSIIIIFIIIIIITIPCKSSFFKLNTIFFYNIL